MGAEPLYCDHGFHLYAGRQTSSGQFLQSSCLCLCSGKIYSADPGSFCRSQSSVQQFYRRKGDRLYDHRSALFCTDADPETSLCRADQRNRRNHKHDPLFWPIHRCHSKYDHPAFYQSAQSRDLCCHGICITAV